MHILFHFLGLWFFSHAFGFLAYLDHLEVAEFVRHSTEKPDAETLIRFSKLVFSRSIAYAAGSLVALLFALMVSSKFKGTWINTVIAFIIFFVLNRLNLTGWDLVGRFLLFGNDLFDGLLYFIINGIVLIALGTFFIAGIRLLYKIPRIDEPFS